MKGDREQTVKSWREAGSDQPQGQQFNSQLVESKCQNVREDTIPQYVYVPLTCDIGWKHEK